MRKSYLLLLLLMGVSEALKAQDKRSSASPHVVIMDTAFQMPELGRTRRIWVYMPVDNPIGRRYPVIYMHDGQNLFDAATSYAGEWGIDEFMDTVTLAKCIVVGIDNGGMKRINEYAPFDMEKYGKGEGEDYVKFIVKTLKPYIDKVYPTMPDRKNTLIAGSSMGGLISLYAMIEYPKVFGTAAVFSPAFWINPDFVSKTRKKARKIRGDIYFYAGKHESESMVTDMLKVMQSLNRNKKIRATSVIREDGKHNEATWRKEFPLFYRWHFGY